MSTRGVRASRSHVAPPRGRRSTRSGWCTRCVRSSGPRRAPSSGSPRSCAGLFDVIGQRMIAPNSELLPVLPAVSDTGPQMISDTTREFMSLHALPMHTGRPDTPTDLAHVESLRPTPATPCPDFERGEERRGPTWWRTASVCGRGRRPETSQDGPTRANKRLDSDYGG